VLFFQKLKIREDFAAESCLETKSYVRACWRNFRMCGKNKPHSVTEGTRDSAKFDVFCAVSKKIFHFFFFVSNTLWLPYCNQTGSRNSWYFSLSLYYTKLEGLYIFILQFGLDLLDGKFSQKWIAWGSPVSSPPLPHFFCGT
jgi:hypothetical protein